LFFGSDLPKFLPVHREIKPATLSLQPNVVYKDIIIPQTSTTVTTGPYSSRL